MYPLRACALLLVLSVLVACTSPAPTKVQPVASQRSADAAVYDQTARFLAGLQGHPDSPFHKLEANPAWQKYSQEFDALWSKLQGDQLQKVASFQKNNLDSLETGSYVFYPFSGPDVLYATAFFPKYTHYILAAQETAGTMRKPADYNDANLSNDLEAWSNALYSIFHRSFFVTGEMSRHSADALLTACSKRCCSCWSAPATPSTTCITSISRRTANLFWTPKRPTNPGAQVHKGVQIQFHKDNDPRPACWSMSRPTSARAFTRISACQQYLETLGHPDAFIKSASFLLPLENVRPDSRLSAKGREPDIVQDDTGRAVRLFHQGP